MIEIDGSHGEGGGQILRTAISLSALTMRPVRITNIRAGRPKPGLKNQHLAGIDVTSKLVNADVQGLEIGSTTIEFTPRNRCGGNISYDVGTAGSISLILQAALPPAVLSSQPTVFHLRGGTDVAWSPPIDYIDHVFRHILTYLGPKMELVMERRGHYPRGGGIVTCRVSPVEHIARLECIEFDDIVRIQGISHCVRLPVHVAERQASSAEKILKNSGHDADIMLETYTKKSDPHFGAGSGIVLWAESNTGVRLGSDSLGRKGLPAEKVGSKAAKQLLEELSTGMAVDSHLADMLVPYLALADGESKIGVTRITSHLRTNLWAIQKMLDVDIILKEKSDGSGVLTIEGRGITLSD